MAALGNHNSSFLSGIKSETESVPQYATADVFYLGALLTTKDGVVAPLGLQSGVGTRFIGVCTAGVETSANGARTVSVNVSGLKVFRTAVVGASAATDAGATVYCSTDSIADLTLTESTNIPVGRVTRWYSATLCDVQLFSEAEALAYEKSLLRKQDSIAAKTGAATISLADIRGGIVTLNQSSGGDVALTVDTGTLMDGGYARIGDAYDWSLINISGSPGTNTGTVTAATGHTLVGQMVIGSATSGLNSASFRTRKTAAVTWITYRI